VAEKVVVLADDYARWIVASLPTAESETMLHAGISGALLSFFADAVSTVTHE
jgi:hypothetical protein